MTNGKTVGILTRDKNDGDKVYLFDEPYLEKIWSSVEVSDAGVQLLCVADADWASKMAKSSNSKGRTSKRKAEKKKRSKKRVKAEEKNDLTSKDFEYLCSKQQEKTPK